MKPRASGKSKNKLFNKMWRLSLSLLRAIAKSSKRFFIFGFKQLSLEISLGITILGLAYLLTSWGIGQNVALVMAIIITLALLILAALIIFNFRQKNNHKLSREVKLARWIARILSDKSSSDWSEYQDWLHDILLARRQLLENKSPRWKVTLITHWRLTTLCIVVTVSKIKRVTSNIFKLR